MSWAIVGYRPGGAGERSRGEEKKRKKDQKEGVGQNKNKIVEEGG